MLIELVNLAQISPGFFRSRVIKLRAENAKNNRPREIPMTDRVKFCLR